MGATSRERYAVVSCHVERPLDDAVWARFAALQDARPGGFAIAALMRPPDAAHGEDEATWLARAREAVGSGAARTSHALDRAGPRTSDGRPAGGQGRARRDDACGTAASPRRCSAAAAGTRTSRSPRHARSSATSTARRRASRPPYLGSRRALGVAQRSLHASSSRRAGSSARSRRPTRSAISRARSRARTFRRLVHVYFHDTDLLDRRRRALLHAGLRVLARRADVLDLDTLAASALTDAPRIAWDDVARL